MTSRALYFCSLVEVGIPLFCHRQPKAPLTELKHIFGVLKFQCYIYETILWMRCSKYCKKKLIAAEYLIKYSELSSSKKDSPEGLKFSL